MENRIIRGKNLDRRLLNRNPRPAELSWVRGEMAAVEIAHSSVVLGNQSSAGSHVFEQPLIICHEILLCVVGANAKHDCSIVTQVFARQLSCTNQGNVQSNLLE